MAKKKQTKLTDRDRIKYDRQIMIEGIGEEGQRKLKATSALIAGGGGLGSQASIYLAVAGIGKLRIVDNDNVELSNLNRQILYWDKDVGRKKADSAEEKLKEINEDIEVETISKTITEDIAKELAKDFDLIVDGMDNYPTRYILNRTALELRIPFFHAAVRGMQGQITTIIPGETACLRCIIPEPPPQEKFPVLGATSALMASVQVHEVIKYVLDLKGLLKNKLLMVYDGTSLTKVDIQRNPRCKDCGKIE